MRLVPLLAQCAALVLLACSDDQSAAPIVMGSSGTADVEAGAGGIPSSGGMVATGGVVETGGSASGGQGGSAGATSSGGQAVGGSAPDDWYPCDGDPAEYDVVVIEDGRSWTVSGGEGVPETQGDLAAALAAGYARLSADRTSKESMLVLGDGTIDASAQVKLPSQIVLNLCGTIEVTGTAAGSDRSPIYARDRSDIDIPHAHITGNAQYGMFFRSVSNLHLGQIVVELNVDDSGIGIRIDNNPSAGGARVTGIAVDHVTGSGTGSHALETYGVDGLTIGRVDASDTGECGVLLNDTANAEVGAVHCQNCAYVDDGYAAFRIANDAGKIGSDWPAGNIHVGEVYARGGGRGIFSVSGSGGLTIESIDIADTGNDAILLKNCYNTTIATTGGTVQNGGIVLSNDEANTDAGTYEPSSNVTLSNLSLGTATISEAWCELGDRGNRAQNISGGSVDMCF